MPSILDVAFDMSKPKTVRRAELANHRMVGHNEKKYSRVILDGEVKNWVGFGWVVEHDATAEDRKKYPQVID